MSQHTLTPTTLTELLDRLEPVETVTLHGVRVTDPDGECDLWFSTERDQLDTLARELDRGHRCRLLSTTGRIIVGSVIA